MRGDNETYYGTNWAAEKQAPSILEDADSQYSHYCVNSAVFTGKERDRETGFSYFGARYYDSDWSGLFLSVDPMSDKYPSLSPYAYCAWNPMRIVDPSGDTIKNAYENYRDIGNEIEYYESLINNSEDADAISSYQKQIDILKDNNRKYNIVNDLLSDYRNNNEKEYNYINDISFKGNPININVYIRDEAYDPQNGAVGQTTIIYNKNDMNKIVGIRFNMIKVEIYSSGFCDEFQGIGTLANEFGDVIFGLSRPRYNDKTNNKGYSYTDIPTTKFSFDYEKYIISQGKHPRPNPWNY